MGQDGVSLGLPEDKNVINVTNVTNLMSHTPALLWAWALLMYRESSFILEPLRHSR